MHLITLINQTDPNLTSNVKHGMTEIHDYECEILRLESQTCDFLPGCYCISC